MTNEYLWYSPIEHGYSSLLKIINLHDSTCHYIKTCLSSITHCSFTYPSYTLVFRLKHSVCRYNGLPSTNARAFPAPLFADMGMLIMVVWANAIATPNANRYRETCHFGITD